MIDSLQLTDKYKVATPANWSQGGDVIILPSLSNDQAKELFPAAGPSSGPICGLPASRPKVAALRKVRWRLGKIT